jgi:uncharacterized protein (TIGR02270 family)
MTAATAIIPHIVEQHVEEAAFLWSQRAAAVVAPHYSLKDLSRLDDRLEAHIDGLRVAGEPGWELCEAALEDDDPGLVFAAAVLAFEAQDGKRIDTVVAAGSRSLETFRGMLSAVGWLREARFSALIDAFLRANSIHYRRLGIAGCGIRRFDPGDALTEAARSPDLFLRSRALKAAGELKRQDLLPDLRKHLDHENHTCRFAAASSTLLLGDRGALDAMSQFVFARSAFRLPAMQIALRCVDAPTAQNWLKALSREPDQMRDVLIGTGIAGDPLYVPTLISRMEDPAVARVAGEAFSMITGVDLAYEDLDGDWPEGFEAGPNDDAADENVELDADEDLPWPNPALIGEWWASNKGAFTAGTRYLAGAAITPDQCMKVLRNGFQRQRNAAALELALSQPAAPWFNSQAPGFRQETQL